MQGALIQSLVRELRTHRLWGMAKAVNIVFDEKEI